MKYFYKLFKSLLLVILPITCYAADDIHVVFQTGGDVVLVVFAVTHLDVLGGLTRLAQGKILGHAAGFDGSNARLLQNLAVLSQLGVVVKVGAVGETTGPGEN